MIRKLTGCLLCAFTLLVTPAVAAPLPIHVVNHAANWKYLHRVEAAALHQANAELAPAWGTPTIVFTDHGWPIYLEPTVGTVQNGLGGGIHGVRDGVPIALVPLGETTRDQWTSAFTHELVEMLVDPYTTRFYQQSPDHFANVEVCDPVMRVRRRYRGIGITDFVLPTWYTNGPGPWDYAAKLPAAFAVH